jgi:hypothetical protein
MTTMSDLSDSDSSLQEDEEPCLRCRKCFGPASVSFITQKENSGHYHKSWQIQGCGVCACCVSSYKICKQNWKLYIRGRRWYFSTCLWRKGLPIGFDKRCTVPMGLLLLPVFSRKSLSRAPELQSIFTSRHKRKDDTGQEEKGWRAREDEDG